MTTFTSLFISKALLPMICIVVFYIVIVRVGKNPGAGCISLLIYLAKLPLCMGLFYVLFTLRQPFPSFAWGAEGADIMAGVAGFFLWGGFCYYWQKARRLVTEHEMITAGGPYRDGQRITAFGPVEAKGPLLTAPFTGRECLGYRYYTSRRSRIGKSTVEVRDYEGYGLIPSIIRSRQGKVRILAKSDECFFEKLPVENVGGNGDNRQRATAYFQATHYGELKGLKQAYHMETEQGLGSFRYDKKPAKDTKKQYSLYESIIEQGQKVNVTGIYSALQKGIEPDQDWTTYPFRLKPGEPVVLEKEIRSNRFKAKLWIALSCLAVAAYYLVIMPNFS